MLPLHAFGSCFLAFMQSVGGLNLIRHQGIQDLSGLSSINTIQ